MNPIGAPGVTLVQFSRHRPPHETLAANLRSAAVLGMKGLFWKRVLTPQMLRGYDVLWLFDADIVTHPAALPRFCAASLPVESVRGTCAAAPPAWLALPLTTASKAASSTGLTHVVSRASL